MTIVIPTQYDKELSRDEALAACGPAAAAAFVQIAGRNPTVREALSLAQARNLWDQGRGMHGPDSEVDLIHALGGKAYKENGTNWAKVRAEVEAGHPVIIDSAAHYFIVTDYDADKDQFYFGPTGTAIIGGSEWMTPGRVGSINAKLDTNPRASIFVDNPTEGTGEQTDYGSGGVQAVAGENDWGQGGSLSPADIQALINANGGKIVGNTKKPGKKIDNPDPRGRLLNPQIEDTANPTWHVEFGNGKDLDVIPTRGADGEADGGWQVVGGTALKPAAGAAGSTTWHWVRQSDGSQVALHTDGTPVTDPTTGDVITQARAGSGGATETAAQANQRAAAADASRASAEHSRALTAQIGKPPPRTPEQTAADIALAGQRDASALKDAQALIPKQTLLLQQAQQTIDYIQRGIAAGTLTVEQADRYMTNVRATVDSGMRGTTPYDEFKDAQRIEQDRRATAAGLINQEVQSTSSLANSLFGDYERGNKDLLVNPGSFNPFQQASATVEAAGGDRSRALANSLLSGLTTPTIPTMPIDTAAPLGSGLPADIEKQLAEQEAQVADLEKRYTTQQAPEPEAVAA